MFKKVKRYLKSPYYALGDDLIKKHPQWMSDKYYLRVLWKQIMGYPLDLKDPKTFNEKIQWSKLYDRNPLFSERIDKIKAKDWAESVIGKEHIIPTLAVYDSVDAIRLDELPDQFVLKCNHDSGGVVICKDKASFDLEAAKRFLGERMQHDFYQEYREWPYKNIERKVFAEKYVVDSKTGSLPDYKIFTFHGIPAYLYVATGRQSEEEMQFDFFDMDFNWLDVRNVHPNCPNPIARPASFETMKELAGKLAEGFRQVRVDFYEVDGQCYFGEMTFFHCAGFSPFDPHSFDEKMGALWGKVKA